MIISNIINRIYFQVEEENFAIDHTKDVVEGDDSLLVELKSDPDTAFETVEKVLTNTVKYPADKEQITKSKQPHRNKSYKKNAENRLECLECGKTFNSITMHNEHKRLYVPYRLNVYWLKIINYNIFVSIHHQATHKEKSFCL